MSLLSLISADLGYGLRPVLREVDFSLSDGDWHILHGANGVGKSTFLRSLVGSLPLLAGERTAVPDLRLSYMPQATAVDGIIPLTVFEVVSIGLWRGRNIFFKQTSVERAFVMENLERIGLENKAGSLFSELSGGQKQRVLLARAICSKPQVLILDEPTTALDTASRVRYSDSLQELSASGTAIVVATHDHDGWPADSSHWVINDGRISVE
ncbi:metal ABC transporter ATP-binding protein [Planctomycetota bacterium]|nr:metal ABC transporter ATP-binding protein [Planctomycetota bacterium]